MPVAGSHTVLSINLGHPCLRNDQLRQLRLQRYSEEILHLSGHPNFYNSFYLGCMKAGQDDPYISYL